MLTFHTLDSAKMNRKARESGSLGKTIIFTVSLYYIYMCSFFAHEDLVIMQLYRLKTDTYR